ncbi:nesprin-1 [Pimephales promelas]|nr:nesprin-1 [Pimephales promelas]
MEVKGKVTRRWEDVAAKKKSGTSLNLVPGVYRHLRDEQEAVQKRTFTKWINSHLAKTMASRSLCKSCEIVKV